MATPWCVGGWRPGLLLSGHCRGWCRCFSPSLSVEGAFGRRRWRGSRVLPTGLPRGLRARLRRSCRWMASICATLGWDGRSISTQGGTYTVPWAGCFRSLRSQGGARGSVWGGIVIFLSKVCARAAEHAGAVAIWCLCCALASQLVGAGRAGGWWLRSRPWSCRVSVPMARWMFRAFASDTPPVRPPALVGAGQHAMWLEEREAAVSELWCGPPSAVAPSPFDSVQKSSVTLARSKVHRSRTRRSAPYVPVIPRSTNSIPLCRSLTSHGVCWAGLGCRAASLCIRDRNRRLWDRRRRLPLPFDVHRSRSSPALVARRLRPFYL